MTDLAKAVTDFIAHELRGKAEPGADEWRVGHGEQARDSSTSCICSPFIPPYSVSRSPYPGRLR